MTGPNESGEARPISVRELLARNGTIGAPIGGRRRRRRGNSESVTVAELTGEIPVVRTGEIPAVADDHADDAETGELAVSNGTAAPVAEPSADPFTAPARPEPADEADEDEPEFDDYLDSIRGHRTRARVRAEQMRPDPVDDDEIDRPTTRGEDSGVAAAADAPAGHDDEELPSYLRGEREHFFGGTEHAADLITHAPTAQAAAAAPITPMAKLVNGGWVVLQSIIAVAFGAGLFLGFDQLWKWNSIVALVLSVLVIIGLVVAVRIVRKTEDIGSTLIAVAVGALVTLGPLALLQSN